MHLLSIIEHWSRVFDDGTNIDVIYFDFQKAFDKVPHQHLLSKLIMEFRVRYLTGLKTFVKYRIAPNFRGKKLS